MREIRIKKAILILWSLLLFGQLGRGQEENIQFETLLDDFAISEMGIVNDIFQDNRGYIWVGTLAGLFRFDGYDERLFTHEPRDSSSISDSKISKILEDEEGYLWVHTQNGLNKYDPKTETFERIFHEQTTGVDLKLDYSYPVGFSDGYLWTITKGDRLCKYDLKKKQYDHSHHREHSGKMFMDSIRHHFEMKNGLILFIRHSGFYTYNAEKDDFEYYEKHLKKPNTQEVYYVMENPEGNLWIGSDKQLHLFNPKTKLLQPLEDFPAYHLPNRTLITNGEIKDRNGRDWLGTQEGLFIYNHQNQSYQKITHDPNNEKSLSSNVIGKIEEDNFGNIWVGTRGGINIYKPYRKKFNYIPTDKKNTSLFIREPFEIEAGKLLLWEKNSLMEIDYLNNKKRPFPFKPTTNLNQWNTGTICYYRDNKGLIWMGMNGGDVFIYDSLAQQFQFLKLPGELPYPGHGNMIGDILEDAYGDMWISTWGNGVFRYNPTTQAFKHYTWNPKDNKSLVSNNVRILFVDSQETLWVSTRNGLCKFDYTSETFTNYSHDPDDTSSISEHTAFGIYESPEGDFWIATYGGGLNKMDREKGIFDYYTVRDGLTDNGIISIYPTNNGQFWIHSFQGLNKFDPKTETFRHYSHKDGLKNKGYNAFAHYQSPFNGFIFVEGEMGIDYFHPDSIKDNPIPPEILITNLKLDNQAVAIGKTKEQLNAKSEFFLGSHISYTNKLRIPPNKQVITFEFKAIHFESPENNEYAYQLVNFDKDWQYVGTKREATYTNLDPGTYVFKVKTANADGIWNDTPAEITLIILPPWWLTWWAKLGYALAGIGAMCWFVWTNRQKVKRKEAELAKERAFSQKLEKINRANQRFVPKNFLKILGKKSIEDLQLGDQIQTKMTILFSDIRSYTTMSEGMSPEDNFKFINGYLGRVGPIIEKHGGFISQYLGDGLMALFLDNNGAAAKAAIDMQQTLYLYNKHRKTKGRSVIQTGIGLNTGQLMLGVIGDKNRYESTVIADAVNTASRMEGLTKVFGAAIIVSERTLYEMRRVSANSKLPETLTGVLKNESDTMKVLHKGVPSFAYRYLGQVKVKGKDKALRIYDLYEGESAKIKKLKAKTRPIFEKAISFYADRKFGKAAECFKQVLVIHESDKAAQYYLDKSVHFIVNGVTVDWNGVEEMVMK